MAVPVYFFDEHQNKLATGAQCCCISIPLREGFNYRMEGCKKALQRMYSACFLTQIFYNIHNLDNRINADDGKNLDLWANDDLLRHPERAFCD
jgi:hypothetical protein